MGSGEMNLNDVRHLLLAQSVEESDSSGTVLPDAERELASNAAGAPLAESASEKKQQSFLIRRAERVVSFLEPRFPSIAAAVKGAPLGRFRLFSLGVIIAALVVGFLTNELGIPGKINILSFPLIGIVLWNFVIYLREIFGLFRGKKEGATNVGSLGRWLAASPFSDKQNADDETSDEPVEIRQSVALFRKNWFRALMPVMTARVKSLLHCAAALLAVAAIGGMYVKGLANEYNAVWASTFFTAETLHPFLKGVLGPASAISGIALPDLDQLTVMKNSPTNEGENAARWIHLYAVTTAVFVILPRLVLAFIWKGRSKLREKIIPFRSYAPAFFDRLLAVSMGDALKIAVLPYAHNPSATMRHKIQKDAEDIIGGAVKLEWMNPIAFGEEDEGFAFERWPADLIVAFNFASTPEKETYGALLKNIGQSVRESEGTTHLHLFLDAESFDRKADSFADFEQRRETRLAGWRELAPAEFGEALHVTSSSKSNV